VIFAFSVDRTTLRSVGIPAWLWFVIAVVATGAGIALLITDRSQRGGSNRERRRWATLRGWQFAEVDRVLPTRWEHGVLAQASGAVATDVVAGSTFTADGRRQVYVLDLEINGRTDSVIAAMRCRGPVPALVEMWVPDVPVPQDSGLDLLGPVGSRYAFVTDLAKARPLVKNPDLVAAVEEIGSDALVVWLENDWVLAALDPGDAEPERLENLLRGLGELADVIDPFDRDPDEAAGTAAEGEPSDRSEPDPEWSERETAATES